MELHEQSAKVGLKRNQGKTKVMLSKLTPKTNIQVDDKNLENVDNYLCFGLLFSIDNIEIEIRRRSSSAWSKFGELSRYLQQTKFPLTLMNKIFPQCFIPTFTYGAETGTITK